MSIASEIFQCYLVLNVLLAFAYFLFAIVRRAFWAPGSRLPHFQLLRVGQFLILLCSLAPAALYVVPAKRLPRVHLSVIRDLDGDPRLSGHVRTDHSLRGTLPVLQPKPQSSPSSWPSIWILGIKRFLTSLDQRKAITLLCFLLLVGNLHRLIRIAVERSELRKILENSIPVRKIGKAIVGVSDEVGIPFSALMGKKAWVVIPMGMTSDWRDFRIALGHELQHHRQRDTLWALAVEWLAVVFYPNPVFTRWRRGITEIQELSCDESLIGRRRIAPHDYGSCLVRVAETALGKHRRLVGTACMAVDSGNPNYIKSFLVRRIEMLRHHEKIRSHAKIGLWLGTALGLVTLTVAYGAQQALRNKTSDAINPGTIVLDDEFQKIAQGALDRAIERYKAQTGFAVITEPSTGRVLAVAQGPLPAHVESAAHWPLAHSTEPASVLKTIVTAAALEQGSTKLSDTYNCEKGKFHLESEVIGDWKAFDELTAADTIIQSSNICGLKIAQKLGVSGLAQMLNRFGMGPDGVTRDFPGARPGDVPTPAEMGEAHYVAVVGTGYAGIHLTPLEILQAYGAIANGGNLMKPIPANAPASSARVLRRVMSEQTSQEMKKVLAAVITKGTRGTASEQASRLYTLAGKTSTAYDPAFPRKETLGGEVNAAGFVGFGPVENPRIAVYVAIFSPKERGVHGSTQAAPVFREIAETALQMMNVPPDKSGN